MLMLRHSRTKLNLSFLKEKSCVTITIFLRIDLSRSLVGLLGVLVHFRGGRHPPLLTPWDGLDLKPKITHLLGGFTKNILNYSNIIKLKKKNNFI